MKYFRTEALVVYRKNFGEADRFVTLLTRSHGKISVLAKGIRRIRSKHAGKMELFGHVEVEIHESRSGMYILTGAELIRPFRFADSNQAALDMLYSCCSLVFRFVPEADENVYIFKSLLAIFQHDFDTAIPFYDLYSAALFVRIFTHYYDIQPFKKCAFCMSTISDNTSVFFQFEHLAVSCDSCNSSSSVSDHKPSFHVPFHMLKLLHFFQCGSISDIPKIAVNEDHIRYLDDFRLKCVEYMGLN